MQFFYHHKSKDLTIDIYGELFKHIVKSRRAKISDTIKFRNFVDDMLYNYKIETIDKKTATAQLVSSEKTKQQSLLKLHIGWCITDPKNITQTISQLNELNIFKLTFIYCKYSQQNYKIDIDRLNKILINSSCQCGRSDILKLEICENLQQFCSVYKDSFMFNFSKNHIKDNKTNINNIVVGCEGGFSSSELAWFKPDKIVGLNNPHILKSTTAVLCVASQF